MLNRCFMSCGYSGLPQVAAQAIYPGINRMEPALILSDMNKICGQDHRSSTNFQVGGTSSGANIWQVNAPPGIVFDIWEDISAGFDTKTYNGVSNGAQIRLNPSDQYGVFNYYIANPKNAGAGFYVSLTPVNLAIPLPPPPPF